MRDENYLIETFSFIYYSVSRRCHLAARAEARLVHSEEISFEDAREKCNVLLSAHPVAFIEKLSYSIATDIAAARSLIELREASCETFKNIRKKYIYHKNV